MRLLKKINEFLEEHGYHGGEPEFVQVSSPVNKKEGWVVKLVWYHHDGDLDEATFANPILDIALQNMLDYLKEREEFYERGKTYYENSQTA